jgi:hypothetical protein
MATERRMDKNKLWCSHAIAVYISENSHIKKENENILKQASFRRLFTNVCSIL